jgi:hypothetical protein
MEVMGLKRATRRAGRAAYMKGNQRKSVVNRKMYKFTVLVVIAYKYLTCAKRIGERSGVSRPML